jgi:hypothetical protein
MPNGFFNVFGPTEVLGFSNMLETFGRTFLA